MLSVCEDFIVNCLIFPGIIDQAHLRQSADKALANTVKLESHYYSDHSSVNIIFKNLLWKGESMFASFPAQFSYFNQVLNLFSHNPLVKQRCLPRTWASSSPSKHLTNINPASQSKITLTGTFGYDYSNIHIRFAAS